MSVNFKHNRTESSLFYDYGTLKIAKELQIKHIRCHHHCIGLLKLLGQIEDFSIPQTGEVVHVNKASLIKQFKEQYKPQGLSDDEIIHIIRASFRQETRKQVQSKTEAPPIGEYVKQHHETFKRIQSGPLAGIGIRGGVVKGTESQHPRAVKFINDLTTYMKSTLPSGVKLHKAIKEQYQILKLIDPKGNWIDDLTKIGDSLLPKQTQARKKCEELIDAMATAAKKNPYFLAAIDNIDDHQLENFRKKVKGDKGEKMMKYLIPYAMALNSLTDTFAKNVHLFDKIDKMWTKLKDPHHVPRYLKLFGMIKYYTLGHLSRLKDPVKNKSIAQDANRHYVNINIMEAVIADMYLGNKNNAEAGSALIKHPSGGKADLRTGAGPTTVESASGAYDVIKLRPDLPKEWADLYTVWNFAFCSNADNFPLLALKLLIPSVNDYTAHPEAYIYHRGIALYLYFQFAILRGIDKNEPDFLIGWDSQEITNALGAANLKSAQDYEERVRKAKEVKIHP